MMLLYWRAYKIPMWFVIDHPYYKLTKSPSPVGFLFMLSKSLYNTKKETSFAQSKKSGLVSVLPSGHGIYSLSSQLLCSVSAGSAHTQSLASYF